jgi:hypothetical protein
MSLVACISCRNVDHQKCHAVLFLLYVYFSAHLSVNMCLKRSKHEKQKQTIDSHLVVLILPLGNGSALITVTVLKVLPRNEG